MPVKVFLSVLVLLLALGAAPARASDEYQFARQIVDSLEKYHNEANNRVAQPRVKGLTAVELGETMENKTTGAKFELRIYYPQGTGRPEVDQWLKAYAEKKLNEYQAEARSLTKGDFNHPQWKDLTFAATRPSAGYLSVIFYESGYTGGAHGYKIYDLVTFDMAAGRPLAAEDVFPQTGDEAEISAGFFVNYVNAAMDKNCLAIGRDWSCRPHSVSLKDVAGRIDNLAFTPQGLVVIYSPYQQASYADGTQYADIPKSDFIAWGFPERFWK